MSNNTIRLCLKSLNILANAALFLLALTGVSLLINLIIAAGLLMPIMLACLCLSVATIPGNDAKTTMLTAFLPFSLYLIATGAVVELYKAIDTKINSRFPEQVHFYQEPYSTKSAHKSYNHVPQQHYGASTVPLQPQQAYSTPYPTTSIPTGSGLYPNLVSGQQSVAQGYPPPK